MFIGDGTRVLAFFAHPDDETLAAGGTLSLWASQGAEVSVAIPSTGITSRGTVRASQAKEEIAHLREQTKRALETLGLDGDRVYFGEFADNAIDSGPLLDLIKWLEQILAQVQPDVVLTHHRFCTNIDHQYCHEAAVVATRPTLEKQIVLLAGEVPSSTGYLRPTGFEPNFYVNIPEAALMRKVAAMEVYEGESQLDPLPRSPEVLRALAKVRGSEAGALFAEAFMIQRMYG